MKKIIFVALLFSHQLFSIEGTEIDDFLLPPMSKEEVQANSINASVYVRNVIAAKLEKIENQIKRLPREIDLIYEFTGHFTKMTATYFWARPLLKFTVDFNRERRKGKIKDVVWFEKKVDECARLLSLYAKNSELHQAIREIQKKIKLRNRLGKRYIICKFHHCFVSLWSVNHLEVTSMQVLNEIYSFQSLILKTNVCMRRSPSVPKELKKDFARLFHSALSWLVAFNKEPSSCDFLHIIDFSHEMMKLFTTWDYIETVGLDD